MATIVKMDEILMANKFGLFTLDNGDPESVINWRVTPPDLFLRKLTLKAISR